MAKLTLKVNGTSREVETDDPDIPLLYVLRGDLGLTGTHFGCGLAQCGACTVLVGGRAVRSCLAPARSVVGQEIVTIEGLGSPERPDPVQAAFIAEQAAQCGYCTAGMVMGARALLARTPRPSEQQVREALAGNLCRCGSHARVIRAVLRAAANPARALMAARVSRRRFLATSLAAGGVLIVGSGLDGLGRAGAQSIPDADRFLGKSLAPDMVDSMLAVHRDGSVTVFVGRVDLGTGGRIALRQIVGEELDIPLERIAMIEGDTALTPNQGGTGGSYGVARGGVQLRRAAATARQALLGLAAQRLGRPADRPRGRRRRGARPGRQRVGELRRADRRPRVQPEGGRRRAAHAPRSLPLHRQVAAASRPAGEDHRAPSVPARPDAAGHAPRPRDPPARVRRHAPLGGRDVDRRPRWRARGADPELPRGGGRSRVGRGARRAGAQGAVERGDRPARSRQGVRGDAGGPGRARPGDRQARRPGRADRAAGGDAHAGRVLPLAHADPRLHRAVLRGGRRADGPRHGVERVPERARLPGHVRPHARDGARPGARHLHGRRGLLRRQRGRRRGRRGGADLEGGRSPGARAVEPAGGARARSQGPRPDAGPARGGRQGRRGRGVGDPGVAAHRHRQPPEHPAGVARRGRASRRRRAAPPG